MVVRAWFMDDSTEDQRKPHQCEPPRPATGPELDALGVLQWHLDADTHESDETFNRIKRERGYTYTDTITISPEKLPNYEEKLKSFYSEHLHTDEEIRFCLEGSGYFDVRDKHERWIRVAVEKGDLLVLPAGIYHRFTLDERNYIKAMRLFVGEPVWTPYNRETEGTDVMSQRKQYVTDFVETVRPAGSGMLVESTA